MQKGGNQPIVKKTQDPPKKTGFTQKPSAKLDVKKTDVFSSKGSTKTDSFQYVYNMGGIPCKIDHGSIKNKLKWNQNVEVDSLNLDPLLITCFEGLVETKHPFAFIAHQASLDLLTSQGATERILPILQRLIWPLRAALLTPDQKRFKENLEVFQILLERVGPAILPFLKNLLSPLSSQMRKSPASKPFVLKTLYDISQHTGEDGIKQIKSQVPDFK